MAVKMNRAEMQVHSPSFPSYCFLLILFAKKISEYKEQRKFFLIALKDLCKMNFCRGIFPYYLIHSNHNGCILLLISLSMNQFLNIIVVSRYDVFLVCKKFHKRLTQIKNWVCFCFNNNWRSINMSLESNALKKLHLNCNIFFRF